MIKKIFTSVLFFSILSSSTLTLWASEAEGHGGHAFDPVRDIVYPWINFILLLLLLIFLLRRPLKDFLASRSKEIAEKIERFAREKQEAQGQLLQYQKRLEVIQKEMETLIASLKEEGEMARKKIIEEARAASARMDQVARLVGSQEFTRAKEALREETVRLAGEWAEKLIRERLTPQDQARMVHRYIQQMERLS